MRQPPPIPIFASSEHNSVVFLKWSSSSLSPPAKLKEQWQDTRVYRVCSSRQHAKEGNALKPGEKKSISIKGRCSFRIIAVLNQDIND